MLPEDVGYMIDNTQAVVSQTVLDSAAEAARDEAKRVEHKISFKIYTADYKHSPNRIV